MWFCICICIGKVKRAVRCEKRTMVKGENTLLIMRLGMNAFRPEIDEPLHLLRTWLLACLEQSLSLGWIRLIDAKLRLKKVRKLWYPRRYEEDTYLSGEIWCQYPADRRVIERYSRHLWFASSIFTREPVGRDRELRAPPLI
jgi:hypothetical protein